MDLPCVTDTPENASFSRVFVNMTTYSSNVILTGFLSVFAITGCSGNLLMIVTIVFSRQFWTISHFHILLRAFNDFAVATIVMPYQAYTAYLGHDPGGCAFIGTLELFTVVLSALYLSAVALNRYLVLRLPTETYQKVYSKRGFALITLVLVLVAFTSVIPIFTGFVEPGFDEQYHLCSPVADPMMDMIEDYSNYYMLSLLFICLYGVPPFIIVIASYCGVWWTFQKSSKTVAQNSGAMASESRREGQIRLTRNLFILTLAFVVCWMPSLVVAMADTQGLIPSVAYIFATMMCYLHSVIYPWLCAILLKPYRDGYKQILMCRCKQSLAQVTPSDTHSVA